MGNTLDAEVTHTVKPSREVKFKLHIAVDFGTDGCGLAFAYNNKVTVYDKWRSKRQRRNKTKTQILLGPDDKVICFGDNAKMMYCGADDNTSKSWRFFERFKMALYENNIKKLNIIDADDDKKMDEIDISHELTATNGAKCESETLFVIAFKHLEQIAQEYVPKITTDEIENEEVQWILTVPAIWSENAKNKMQQWMIKAELVDGSVKDQCIIVYEPDCASAALQKQFLSTIENKPVDPNTNTNNNENENENEIKIDAFNAGDKYILIDAGGGTVDVACHQILDIGGVEEIMHPTGDKWGSCYIDDEYIELLNTIFPKEWIDEYKEKTPGKYVEIIDYFQYAKCTFYEDILAKTHDIQLPYEFLCFLEEKCNQINGNPEAIIKQFRKPVEFYKKLFNNVDIYGDKNNLQNIYGNQDDEKDGNPNICQLTQVTVTSTRRNRNDEEYIEMDVRIWKCMFDAMINNIINHVHKLLSTDVLKNECKYLCMCGGFSASLYFQEQMKRYFGSKSEYNLRVIIPTMPMLSVVQGAAYIGLSQPYIKARRLKYTYGIKMFFNKSAAKNKGISDEYINDNTTSDGMVRDCFKIIAKRNDRIALNEIKSCVSFKTSQISLIPILRSNKRYPRIALDGMEESVIKIQHLDGTKEEIVTEFHFYGTMFTVCSYPKNNPNEKEKVDINYE